MIRKYQAEDLEIVLDIWYQASLVAHGFLTAEFLQEERVKLKEVFLPQSETWVYELDGDVVGFLSLVENEVGGLFIRPSHQRQGIGRALMDKAASLHPVLVLDVFEKNGVGRPFYTQYGFTQVDKQQDTTTGEMLLRLRYGSDSVACH
ncbi:MAG: GNAT family N-acetyltransferase [Anaerolineales bacterium]|nr:GNAT family N-acetyltransferase [Anaerolineales bacterium]